ncbi:hypothetical protein HNQ92_002361 [Rhabdobacter roseus]|uniref:Uncharacterized protein n=1 Tax=Rhabdobacter roseus TaxID=1655419 RepID=A0A840TVQ8_9BACT|nr:hypothetical protein [Rhabdobacter roseus]
MLSQPPSRILFPKYFYEEEVAPLRLPTTDRKSPTFRSIYSKKAGSLIQGARQIRNSTLLSL